MVELGEQVDRKVPGMMQHNCGGHLRPGTWLCKVERSDANLIADAEGVHLGTRRRSKTWLAPCGKCCQEVDGAGFFSQAYHVGFGAGTPSLPCVQVVSRFAWRTLGCVQIEVRAHLEGRRLDQGNGRGGKSCKASQLECIDRGDFFGNSTNEWDIVKPEWTSSLGKCIISGRYDDQVQPQTKQPPQCTRRQRRARLGRGLSVFAQEVLMQPQAS